MLVHARVSDRFLNRVHTRTAAVEARQRRIRDFLYRQRTHGADAVVSEGGLDVLVGGERPLTVLGSGGGACALVLCGGPCARVLCAGACARVLCGGACARVLCAGGPRGVSEGHAVPHPSGAQFQGCAGGCAGGSPHGQQRWNGRCTYRTLNICFISFLGCRDFRPLLLLLLLLLC